MHRLLLLFLISLLNACEFQPVAVGVWDMETNLKGELIENERTVSSVWTITDYPKLSITSQTTVDADELELAGSRISWSSSAAIIELPDGTPARVNFNGTVDGNRLFGTLYTQAGNFRVDGVRR